MPLSIFRDYTYKECAVLGIGAVVLGFCMAKLYRVRQYKSSKIYKDFKSIENLRQTIKKAGENSKDFLHTLSIEKKIEVDFNNRNVGSNLKMVYLISPKLSVKAKTTEQQLRNPFLPPFEDGFFITQLEPYHRLMFNKFNIFENHLLVITKQYESQEAKLKPRDFKMTLKTVEALEGGVFFFNCGKQSGASQPHKHIQCFPARAMELPIMKAIENFVQKQKSLKMFEQKGTKVSPLEIVQFEPYANFMHGLVVLPQIPKENQRPNEQQFSPLKFMEAHMFQAYELLSRSLLRWESQLQETKARTSYNLIGNSDFLMMVPRKKDTAFSQIGLNATGFMGTILFRQQELLNKYMHLGISPEDILKDITYDWEE